MSKTWLPPFEIESSSLQKPLLYILLSTIHLIPELNDYQHILLTKGLFTVLGIATMILLSVLAIEPKNDEKYQSYAFRLSLYSLFLLAAAPSYSYNFASVRSDQLGLFLFSLSAFFLIIKNNLKYAIVLAAIIPIAGVKNIIFIPAILFLILLTNKQRLSKKQLIFLSSILIAVFVWILGLNPDAIRYIIDIYRDKAIFRVVSIDRFKIEFFWFSLSIFIFVYKLFKSQYDKTFNFSFISAYFFIFFIFYPQNYPYFIASIVPFSILSFLCLLDSFQIKRNELIQFSLILILTISILVVRKIQNYEIYQSSKDQIAYIKHTYFILDKFKLSYLDGVGIYPRQNIGKQPCFSSPGDLVSNKNCIDQIYRSEPDVIINTGRLLYTLNNLTYLVQDEYIEILPNFWIKKDKYKQIKDKIVITKSDLYPAFVLF